MCQLRTVNDSTCVMVKNIRRDGIICFDTSVGSCSISERWLLVFEKRDHEVIPECSLLSIEMPHPVCDASWQIKILRIVVSGRHDRVRGVHKGALGNVTRQPGRKTSLWVLRLSKNLSTRIWRTCLSSYFVCPSLYLGHEQSAGFRRGLFDLIAIVKSNTLERRPISFEKVEISLSPPPNFSQ